MAPLDETKYMLPMASIMKAGLWLTGPKGCTCVYVLVMTPRAKMPSRLFLLVGGATLKRPSPTICDQAQGL